MGTDVERRLGLTSSWVRVASSCACRCISEDTIHQYIRLIARPRNCRAAATGARHQAGRRNHVTGQTLVSRHVTSTDYYTCASHEYIARNGAPAHPAELENHPDLAFRTEHAADGIVFNAPDRTRITVSPKPAFYANNIGMVRECAMAGLGVATLSAYLVDDDIGTGKLTRLFPEYSLPDREFRIVYSNRKFLPLKVKAFVDMAVEHFRQAGGERQAS